ncbi:MULTISPECIES: hypothetical protein [Pseudomonas]|jgi:hypothetical protein|uniref:Uncharacterized protein n=1 Tax=Pseudomonas fluorescens LMG 5329 TaxID=1324332 RepID=A0A0A1Z0R0_PSEFL|nr:MULTISPECIES: hypothetical protein [Pseudomonas]KGE66686.1 hypothetical protein K814_0118040 [Pseudomonas fluorescens LMG 5329]NWC75313.1 hypothetical protein [Pseudomonas sp. P7759]NWD99903.1 hypothetical protein [Pseudomonas sp. IPO3749]NWF19365.1 hypothetical protein [Pseudomonas sp. IPO3749]
MGLIVGTVLVFVVLAVLASLIERGAASRMLRPYIGLLLISSVIAGMGLLLGFLSTDVQGFFYIAAKVLAVLVGVALCAHLIIIIAKRWL